MGTTCSTQQARTTTAPTATPTPPKRSLSFEIIQQETHHLLRIQFSKTTIQVQSRVKSVVTNTFCSVQPAEIELPTYYLGELFTELGVFSAPFLTLLATNCFVKRTDVQEEDSLLKVRVSKVKFKEAQKQLKIFSIAIQLPPQVSFFINQDLCLKRVSVYFKSNAQCKERIEGVTVSDTKAFPSVEVSVTAPYPRTMTIKSRAQHDQYRSNSLSLDELSAPTFAVATLNNMDLQCLIPTLKNEVPLHLRGIPLELAFDLDLSHSSSYSPSSQILPTSTTTSLHNHTVNSSHSLKQVITFAVSASVWAPSFREMNHLVVSFGQSTVEYKQRMIVYSFWRDGKGLELDTIELNIPTTGKAQQLHLRRLERPNGASASADFPLCYTEEFRLVTIKLEVLLELLGLKIDNYMKNSKLLSPYFQVGEAQIGVTQIELNAAFYYPSEERLVLLSTADIEYGRGKQNLELTVKRNMASKTISGELKLNSAEIIHLESTSIHRLQSQLLGLQQRLQKFHDIILMFE